VSYPQNGDRIVTIDSVTSLRPMYTPLDMALTRSALSLAVHFTKEIETA